MTDQDRPRKGKAPRGLGRGLAGILEARPERKERVKPGALSLLLGADGAVVSGDVDVINKIHKVVIDAAVAAMVEGFSAEGAVVANRSIALSEASDEGLPNLSLRVPPSCSVSSPLLFALYGQLSQLLETDSPPGVVSSQQHQLGDTWVWMYRVEDDGVADDLHPGERPPATVAATFRAAPFEPWETEALSSLVASVAFTLGGNKKQINLRRKLKADTTVTLAKSAVTDTGAQGVASSDVADGRYLTEAQVRYQGSIVGVEPGLDGFVTGTAVAADPTMAVAEAAASIRQSNHDVVFAGSSEIGTHSVTIVMLTEAGTRPRLGVAVHDPGDLNGVVEAVLTATTR